MERDGKIIDFWNKFAVVRGTAKGGVQCVAIYGYPIDFVGEPVWEMLAGTLTIKANLRLSLIRKSWNGFTPAQDDIDEHANKVYTLRIFVHEDIDQSKWFIRYTTTENRSTVDWFPSVSSDAKKTFKGKV